MRKLFSAINLYPNRTAFVECHGIGTSISDPIEEGCFHQPSLRPNKQGSRCLITRFYTTCQTIFNNKIVPDP